MRFFILLPQFSGKSQLQLLSNPANTVVFSMQNQVFPVCQGLFSLSLSVSGMIGALFCTPALANLGTSNFEALASPDRHTITDRHKKAIVDHLPGSTLPVSDVAPLYPASPESAVESIEPAVAAVDLTTVALTKEKEDAAVVRDRDSFDQAHKSQVLAVEAHHQPNFVSSSCGAAECTEEIAALLDDPAMSHADGADIGLPNTAIEDVLGLAKIEEDDTPERLSQVPDLIESIPEERLIRDRPTVDGSPDEELGDLRLQLQRSRQNEDLGILRLLKTAEAAPEPPPQPIAYLSGRLGFLDSDNVFRSNGIGPSLSRRRKDEQVYQSGLTFFLFPKLSDSTNLYAIAGTTLARYERAEEVNFNQLQLQLGIRQKLFSRTYAQLGWRNQTFYTPGYRKKQLTINSIDAQLSHRSILNSRMWIDGFYQARLGFADLNDSEERPKTDTSSRFRQTFTLALNYGITRDLRTSLLYQLDLEDFTQISRFDVYQQVLGSISYKVTPETRFSVFGGTRFGNSSDATINLDDTFYGAGLNLNLPLF